MSFILRYTSSSTIFPLDVILLVKQIAIDYYHFEDTMACVYRLALLSTHWHSFIFPFVFFRLFLALSISYTSFALRKLQNSGLCG